jgi:hypothetical protein
MILPLLVKWPWQDQPPGATVEDTPATSDGGVPVITTIVLLSALVVGLLLVVRYGADSRGTGDPTGRDPAWPSAPTREHTPARDLALVRAAIARAAAQVRCWELFERSLRPWEGDRPIRQHGPQRSPSRTAAAPRWSSDQSKPSAITW